MPDTRLESYQTDDLSLDGVTLSEWLDRFFEERSVMEMYSVVQDARNALGFAMPDNDRIMDQCKYATMQFRKFTSTIKPAIMNMVDQGAAAIFKELVERKKDLDAYPDSEREAIYFMIRDNWLNALLNALDYWYQRHGE